MSVKGKKKLEEVMLHPVKAVDRMYDVIDRRDPSYQICIEGKIPSKKNGYSPMANGKGFFKGSKLLNAEKMVSFQIPGELRELKLKDPHVLVQFSMPKKSWRSDRDNAAQAVLDYLVQFGVLKDDSINALNGFLLMAPVIESNEYKCLVSIWRNDETE